MKRSLGLILVQTKFHTIALEKYLNDHADLARLGIKVGRLTGQGSTDEMALPGNQQATALDLFRRGEKRFIHSLVLTFASILGEKEILVATGRFDMKYD